jgi:hypothetical protein
MSFMSLFEVLSDTKFSKEAKEHATRCTLNMVEIRWQQIAAELIKEGAEEHLYTSAIYREDLIINAMEAYPAVFEN